MIIILTRSIIFTKDPDMRFAEEYEVAQGIWRELWKKYKLQGYELKDLCDLLLIRTGKQISKRTMKRWISRSEIYSRTRPVLDKGVQSVTSDFFGDLEWNVLGEMMRNLKVSGTKMVRILP